jgi:hypothetical protein
MEEKGPVSECNLLYIYVVYRVLAYGGDLCFIVVNSKDFFLPIDRFGD